MAHVVPGHQRIRRTISSKLSLHDIWLHAKQSLSHREVWFPTWSKRLLLLQHRHSYLDGYILRYKTGPGARTHIRKPDGLWVTYRQSVCLRRQTSRADDSIVLRTDALRPIVITLGSDFRWLTWRFRGALDFEAKVRSLYAFVQWKALYFHGRTEQILPWWFCCLWLY